MPYRFDIVAGLTAAAVVLPKGMAYATIAGLPVAVGLYNGFCSGCHLSRRNRPLSASLNSGQDFGGKSRMT